MPVFDGYAAADAIRNLGSSYGSVPILALSVRTAETDVARAVAAGMAGVIAKPFDAQDFAASIRRGLGETEEACSGERRTDDAATIPPWNRHAFGELCAGLEPAAVTKIVTLFAQRLSQVRALLSSGDGTGGELACEAQDLVAPACLLGFKELCDAAKTMRNAITKDGAPPADTLETDLGATLHGAVERAAGIVAGLLYRNAPPNEIAGWRGVIRFPFDKLGA